MVVGDAVDANLDLQDKLGMARARDWDSSRHTDWEKRAEARPTLGQRKEASGEKRAARDIHTWAGTRQVQARQMCRRAYKDLARRCPEARKGLGDMVHTGFLGLLKDVLPQQVDPIVCLCWKSIYVNDTKGAKRHSHLPTPSDRQMVTVH